MSVLPNRMFRKVSLFLRLTLIISLIVMLCTSFAVLPVIRDLPGHRGSLLRYPPSVWYLGLYQWMQGRSNPELVSVAWIGLKAVGAAFALAISSPR